MKKILWIVVASVVLGCEKKPETAAPEPAKTAAAPMPSVKGKAVAVTVGSSGFAPSQVTVNKGEPATLVFTRTTDATCAKEVVFPDLKITKELPLNQPIPIEVPAGEAKSFTFQCGMGMYQSKVVVQ